MKKGFTLIELLVVVLIIGILAAVALPQYNKAVEKSRAAEAFTNGRALFDSVQRYHLENNTYPTKFEELDIDFNLKNIEMYANTARERGELGNGKFWIYLYIPAGTVLVDRVNNLRYTIVFCNDGTRWCGASTAETSSADIEKRDKEVCLSLGGKLGTPTATTCNTGRSVNYQLQ